MTIEIEKLKKKIEKSIRNVNLNKNEIDLHDFIVFNCNG